jgi:hypothetical protein
LHKGADAAAESQYENIEVIPNLDFKENPDIAAEEEESKQCEPYDYTSDPYGIEDASSEESSAEAESTEFGVPDLDDESTWKLPDLGDYVAADEIKENVIFFIHTTAVVSAVGFLLSWG